MLQFGNRLFGVAVEHIPAEQAPPAVIREEQRGVIVHFNNETAGITDDDLGRELFHPQRVLL